MIIDAPFDKNSEPKPRNFATLPGPPSPPRRDSELPSYDQLFSSGPSAGPSSSSSSTFSSSPHLLDQPGSHVDHHDNGRTAYVQLSHTSSNPTDDKAAIERAAQALELAAAEHPDPHTKRSLMREAKRIRKRESQHTKLWKNSCTKAARNVPGAGLVPLVTGPLYLSASLMEAVGARGRQPLGLTPSVGSQRRMIGLCRR
ncbi:hypothetical protein FA15DRAFT_668605 [Coprinopsis marcescibilis]|uniref:Uncharacterized protein n=1 Tax=Coprinopsis marcescibilis TaxID=230819 RepID=A0A5C3KY87_COPMA|nr:hypothetical protein FA15DRAFT_668605 [Coprinopsis marcescibilis]